MKEEIILLKVYFSVPRERKRVLYLGPASKDGDTSVVIFFLKLNAPCTAIKCNIFSDYKLLITNLIFDSSLTWLSSAS